MCGEERADHGRRRHSPDRKAEEYRCVLRDVGDFRFQRRLIATVTFLLRLADRLEVVVGIWIFRLDLEQISVQSAADLARDDARVSASGKVRDKNLALRELCSRSRGDGCHSTRRKM